MSVRIYCILFFCLITNLIGAQNIKSQNKLITCREIISTKNLEETLDAIQNIAWDQPDTTIAVCQYLLNQNIDNYTTNDIANINYINGRAERAKGNYQSSLLKFNKCLELGREISDSLIIAKASYQIGIMNLFLGNMQVSINHLTEATSIYDKIGNSNQKADILNALASYYSDNELREEALNSYLKALEIYENVNDTLGQANIHANLGMEYIDMANFSQATFHINKQGHFDSLLNTQWGLGFYYDFKGYLMESQNDYEQAYYWYKLSLETRKKLDSHYNLCESNISIGKLLYKTKKYEEAKKYLNEIFKYQDAHNSLTQEQSSHLYLSKCYEETGDLKSALNHYKSYKIVTDSIYQKDRLTEIAEKEVLLKQSELDKQIALLNKDREISEYQLIKQKTIIIACLLGFILISIFSIFLYKLYRKIKLHNSKITAALNDKDILLREIHHRVKNNLQVISSLLSLQSRQIKDSNIRQAIDEGRNRVRSMALIHQNLYQRDNLTSINVNTYLIKLIEELFETYNISEDKIKLELNITTLDLDVDTMIPMGLIINELVSNSLKHAFKDNESGKISISLTELNQQLILNVSDNGIGIDAEKMYKSKSFGNRLIKAFGQKLKADMIIKSKNGTHINMTINNYKKAA